MVGTRSEKRRGLGGIIARPKLSILFALLIFLVLVAGAKVTIPPPQATAVIEIRANPLHDQIAALESGLAPGSIVIGREAERLRSVDMALAVLAQLPDEEVAAIGTDNGTRLAPAGDPSVSAKVAAIREALEITADAQHGQISISFRAADPDHAAAMANLFAETYVQQRQSDKQRLRRQVVNWITEQRLRRQVVDWITERRQIIDTGGERAVDADAAGTTGVASGALQTPQADPTEAARPQPSGATSPASNVRPDRAIAEQSRATQDEFLRQATPLLTSTAWAEPAAVVRSAASPPLRAALLADGLALMLAVPISLIMGVALGRLVDIVWPVGERRPTFYDNPYWPHSGDDVTPRRGRMLSNAKRGRQLIATGSSTPSTSSPAKERWIRTRQEQMLPRSRSLQTSVVQEVAGPVDPGITESGAPGERSAEPPTASRRRSA